MTTPFKMQGWSPFLKTSPLKQSYPSTSQFSGDYHVKWNPSGSKPNTWKGLKSGYKPHQVSKGVTFTKRVPGEFVKHKLVEKPLSTIGKKQLAKAITVKGAASRAIPVIGAGLLAYDVLKTGVKRVAEGIKTGVPQTKLTGEHIKDTFTRVKKKKYI